MERAVSGARTSKADADPPPPPSREVRDEALQTPFIDLDILNPGAAEAAEELIRERFEERGYILPRIGLAPKRAIPFRTDAPFAKIAVELVAANAKPDAKAERIEFLGDGQQVACFGVHPDTQRPYAWPRGEPGQIAREDLPYISADEARQLVEDIVELPVREYGYRRKAEARAAKGNGAPGGGFDWDKLGDLLDHDNLASVAMALVADIYTWSATGMRPGGGPGSSGNDCTTRCTACALHVYLMPKTLHLILCCTSPYTPMRWCTAPHHLTRWSRSWAREPVQAGQIRA
jgi:hypothetical protein